MAQSLNPSSNGFNPNAALSAATGIFSGISSLIAKDRERKLEEARIAAAAKEREAKQRTLITLAIAIPTLVIVGILLYKLIK